MVLTAILVFLTILAIELVLSIDNASVLAVMVNKKLDTEVERKKALKYGILGAYVFRGLSLALVSWIIYNPEVGAWFKIIGGLYLTYLFYGHLKPKDDNEAEDGKADWLERICSKLGINRFWSVVIMVEFLDIVFSIDNLVAVVSLSNNIYIVIGAVFIGILGMRFVAQYFSKLLQKYPTLENSAFLVILLLGVKMLLAGIMDFFPTTKIHEILNGHTTDLVFSAITLVVFLFPIIRNKYKRNNLVNSQN